MRLSNIAIGAFFGVASLAMFSKGAFAKVDIALEDNKQDRTITVTVNSNGSYIDGVDMDIVFSDNLEISDIQQTEVYCSLGKSNDVTTNKLSLECFNDSNVEMDGVFAKFSYATEEDDYFFYVDEDILDIGTLPLGTVTDINKPVVEENEDTDEEVTEATTLEKVRDFLSDNSLYVLAGVVFLIACVVAIVGFSSKYESVE